MKEVQTECPACGGTGLYSGFAEPKGVAVICLKCNGSGCAVIRYRPFTARKRKRGIKTVRQSRGVFIGTGVGPVRPSMTVKEFYGKEITP